MAVPAQGPNGVYCRATLVVCPLVAVIQWRQEIARFTAPGALKVCLRCVSIAGLYSGLHACCSAVQVTRTSLSGPAAQQIHPCEPLGAGRCVTYCVCWP